MRLRNFQCLLALVAVIIGATIASPHFFTWSNVSDVLRFASVAGVLAVGMTVVILTAGIDLSVGSVLALANVLAAGLMVWNKLPIPLMFVVCLGAGAAVGLANGVLITRGRLQPFVATLAMMLVARGLAQWYSHNNPITGLPPAFSQLNGTVGGVPVPALIFIGAVLLVWLVLSRTTFGRNIYAVGGGEEAARLSGVRVSLVKTGAYALCGAAAALAALMHTAKINVGHPAEGVGFELDAIAAVVLGGTDLMGGRGNVLWTFAGALTLQVITNILLLLNCPPAIARVVKGAIIIAAILLGRLVDLLETRLSRARA
jgi:ribose transport system permease protein